MQHKYLPSQMSRTLTSIIGINPYLDHDSSPRIAMLGSHLGQTLPTVGRTERYLNTGMEQEFGRFTLSIRMPCDANVLAVFPRYIRHDDINIIRENPETIIVFENAQTGEVDALSLPTYCSYHSYFGFPYIKKPIVDKIRKGFFIEKDTVLLEAPSITEHGNYKYGTEVNVALMTHPAVAEDGYVICRDVLDRFKFPTYEVREVEWGKKEFLLNLYGNDKVHKGFPDIGEYIRDDGVLLGLRSHDTGLAPIRQHVKAMQRLNHNFDKRVYADGKGGKVIDIQVVTNGDVQPHSNPTDHQLVKYIDQTRDHHNKIVQFYKNLKFEQGKRGNKVVLGHTFHSLVTSAMIHTDYAFGMPGGKTPPRNSKIYRKKPLDEYWVRFIIEYETAPNFGFKFTDTHGGVINVSFG